MYRLNQIYLKPEDEFQVIDSQKLMQIGQSDYQADDTDVKPAADPTNVSEQLRLTKAQALIEMIPLGTINALEATKRVLEAMEQPDIEKLINQQPPPPDPKLLQVQAKMEADKQKAAMDMQKAQVDMQVKQQMGQFDMQMKQVEIELEAMKAKVELHQTQQKAMIDMAIAKQDAQVKTVASVQKMDQQSQQHSLKMDQQKQQHELAQKQMKEKANQQAKKGN